MTELMAMDDEPEAKGTSECAGEAETSSSSAAASLRRKDKRKALKKEKRKQKRKEVAEMVRQEEEARLNDPEEQRRIQLEEERERERVERERKEFEERERMFLEELARRKAEEEEARRLSLEEEEQQLKQKQVRHDNEVNEEDDWEYVEEGPPEIIWQGNEIIVKKNKVRVKKKEADNRSALEDPNRPTSNPLPPQSEAFAEYKNASVVSAQQLLDDVAQQTPNFGTEHDKAHCPFHLKTGACRFGPRCSRVHFYPDKSCTLLMKNMYNGPGLAWEQDEGLEHTDEEVERCYEEFYEDVHTELMKFGEIINFKVCRNSSSHLRGNVYVHYKSLESAILAYHSINARFFAGKQVTCEFVNVTRWKVAICGEYMKSKLKSCSRGTACNFIHCFRNPGGDYEWADWDKPPPRYWIRKMAALFGYMDESGYERQIEEENSVQVKDGKMFSADSDRSYPRRSQSKEVEFSKRSSRSHHDDKDVRRSAHRQKHSSIDRKGNRREEKTPRDYHDRYHDSESDRDWSDGDGNGAWHQRSRTPRIKGEFLDGEGDGKSRNHDSELHSDVRDYDKERHRGNSRKRSRHREDDFKESKSRRTKSSREQSSMDKIEDIHVSHKRSSRHPDEVPILLEDRWDGRSRTHDSDHSGDWSE